MESAGFGHGGSSREVVSGWPVHQAQCHLLLSAVQCQRVVRLGESSVRWQTGFAWTPMSIIAWRPHWPKLSKKDWKGLVKLHFPVQ
eukprot:6456406-Amphidinium_carterae.1